METTKLRRFAQYARRNLLELVETRLQLVLQPDSAARREAPAAVKQLETQIRESSREQVIDRVAYTWFNRFSALRYMDVNRVNRISVVSPLEGQFQPEILAEAKMGHIDEEMVPAPIQAKVRALLDGTAPSPDPQQEAYRLLVVAACNYWQGAMPFLFEAIADYTELLIPDDLLSGNSILAYTREAMTPDACEDVEVIGWLYQFYISEKKDEVFEGLKKNKKITPENIPAATQLFTPHWIVRYLVENSLGRLWLLNRPNSKLAAQMDYYIAPQEPVTDFLRIAKPEDIKLCDPACGSGHMLTYAFDLLYAIYDEEGTDPVEIPEKILTHNLYGIEIDERAAELAAFALTMKARGKQRRFLNKRIQPAICVLRPIKIAPQDLDAYVAEVGRDLFTANLRTLLNQFGEADNFGSLIRPVAMDYAEIRRVLAEKGIGNQLLLEHVHRDVLRVLEQAEYLSQRYQVVVANPPYMGSGGMNGRLVAWAKENYPASKSDLFAMFIERNLDLVAKQGAVGMITMQSWMFLSSYEKLRTHLLNNKTLTSMAHLGPRAFDSIGGEVVSTTAFVFENAPHRELKGDFMRLVDGASESEKDRMIREAIGNHDCGWYHRAASADFQKIPGGPIAYWVSHAVIRAFDHAKYVGSRCDTRKGMATGLNAEFVRVWHEVSRSRVGLGMNRAAAKKSGLKWFPYANGGPFRKWSGNYDDVVNWENDGYRLQTELHESGRVRAVNLNLEFIFREGLSWTSIGTTGFSIRKLPVGFAFSSAANALFSDDDLASYLGLLNSKVHASLGKVLNPTVNSNPGDIGKIPLPYTEIDNAEVVQRLIAISDADWDSYETSWNFKTSPMLLEINEGIFQVAYCYQLMQKKWQQTLTEMQSLEEENNRIFIEAYGLQDELTPDGENNAK